MSVEVSTGHFDSVQDVLFETNLYKSEGLVEKNVKGDA